MCERIDNVENEMDVGSALAPLGQRGAVNDAKARTHEEPAVSAERFRIQVAGLDKEPAPERAILPLPFRKPRQKPSRIRRKGLGRLSVHAVESEEHVVEVDEDRGAQSHGGGLRWHAAAP